MRTGIALRSISSVSRFCEPVGSGRSQDGSLTQFDGVRLALLRVLQFCTLLG